MRFVPVRLLHGKLPIVGWRVEHAHGQDEPTGGPFPLAYCTDVSAVPPEAWPVLRGLGTLVLDALRRTRHPTHLSLDQALVVAERVGAGRTYFIHMSHDLGHASTQAELPEGVELAYDGLTLA